MAKETLPVPDNDAAVDFLRWYEPRGPWVLTAVGIDKKSINTQTFRPETEDRLRAWLERENGKRNCYFMVNPPTRDLDKKAEREDVRALAWLHVDIDPRAGEDLDAERERALRLLRQPLLGIPPPTLIIFSGGGYQGFWRLSDPMAVDGNLSRAEDAKLYNLALELAFGADHCHNVDRIMRLPGTINLPDKRKQAKGRKPTLAGVEERHDDRSYELRQFSQAPPVQLPSQQWLGEGSAAGEQTARAERLADLSDLDQWGVPERIKIIIAQGKHPDEQKSGDNSRSAWVFDAVCGLRRCGVPEEVIFSVLTDRGFGISESILDKGSNAERYALRQIARAREHAVNPLLMEYNERFAVIGSVGGKCLVAEEVPDDVLNRPRLTFQTPEAFRNRYVHVLIEQKDDDGKVKYVRAGKWWLEHPNRRFYDFITFNPGQEVRPGWYNMWRGYGVQSRPGTAHEAFLAHTREVMCAGSEEHYDYVIKWLARMVQKPYAPAETALVWRGEMGVGKGLWARWLMDMIGRHSIHVSNPSHLVGNFNRHLRDCVLLFADEAFYAGDKRHESILRQLITERSIMIEAKGIDAESFPNHIHLVMCSNKEYVVPASMDERRYFVGDVSSKYKDNHRYFRELNDKLAEGGPENLLHYLLTVPLEGFNVRVVPQTQALVEQKMATMSHEEEWWYGRLCSGAPTSELEDWQVEVPTGDLYRDYLDYMRNLGVLRRANQTMFGRFLGRVLPPTWPRNKQRLAKVRVPTGDGYDREVEKRVRFYVLPTLAEARKHHQRRFKFNGDWPEGETLPLEPDAGNGEDRSDKPF